MILIKLMLKIILKLFILIFTLTLGVGGYYFIFPIYPDYDISESYFDTRFSKQGYDSQDNGIKEWKSLNDYLNKQGRVLNVMDAYYKCYYGDYCSLTTLGWEDEENKEEKLEEFLESPIYKEEYPKIMSEVFRRFEEINTYKFISTLNTKPKGDDKILLGPEIITYTRLISFTRSLAFYNNTSSGKKFLQNYIKFYTFLSDISYKLDDGLIGYLVIMTLGDIHFSSLERELSELGKGEKTILSKLHADTDFSGDMVQNGLKGDFWYIKGMYQSVMVDDITLEVGKKTSWFKKTFFYNHRDSMNLLKKQHQDMISNKCDFVIKGNGRNLIGRIMIQTGKTCYKSQFKKQEALLEKREELIQLLSN